MRIDAPSGSGAWISGSFFGNFKGELEGLSGSLQELHDYTTNTSASINTTIYSLSGSFNDTINSITGSMSGSIAEVSRSIDQTIHSVSASIDQRITSESASINTSIQGVSSSLSNSIAAVSTSLDQRITRESASISGTIASISNSLDQRITLESSSIHDDIYRLSGSFDARDNLISSSVGQISASINTTIHNVSASISGTIVSVSNDINARINAESASAAEDRGDIRAKYTRLTDFQQYTASVDQTYYKSGSDAYLGTLIVSGNTLLKGDLIVSGTTVHIHTEDVYIKDKFVQIASGSTTPLLADGAGFGIDGANVTMSYSAADDTLHLNKPFTVNVTGSLYGTASYASNVTSDSNISRSLDELYNMVHLTTGSVSESSSIYLDCSANRTYQTCQIVSQSNINLLLPAVMQDSVEHFILFINSSDHDCILVPPSSSLVPAPCASTTVDGGYADSKYNTRSQIICSKGKGLGMDYTVKAGTIVFTRIGTYL